MWLVCVAELAVHLVREEEEIVLACDFSESKHAFLRVLCTCRVARVADEDCLGLIGDSLLELFDVRYLESVSDVSRDCLEGKTVHEGECVVVGVEWLENDYFVARVTSDFKCQVHTLATCNCGDELVNSDVDTDLLVVFLHKSLSEVHKTC